MLQMCICINCNISTHLFCAEYLMEQNPVKDRYYISVTDLSKEGMVQWKKTPVGEKQNVTFCILCQAKVKAVKVLAHAMKVADKASKRKSAGNGSAAKKKVKCTKAPAAIICELCRLAAFQAQLYIFTKAEKSKADVRLALIKDHFHRNTKKHIQGACTQLIEGVGAFRLLYNCTEGETNV
jgi:hypothetical protein